MLPRTAESAGRTPARPGHARLLVRGRGPLLHGTPLRTGRARLPGLQTTRRPSRTAPGGRNKASGGSSRRVQANSSAARPAGSVGVPPHAGSWAGRSSPPASPRPQAAGQAGSVPRAPVCRWWPGGRCAPELSPTSPRLTRGPRLSRSRTAPRTPRRWSRPTHSARASGHRGRTWSLVRDKEEVLLRVPVQPRPAPGQKKSASELFTWLPVCFVSGFCP